MARAYLRAWVRIAQCAALALVLGGMVETLSLAQERPSRAHNALTAGIECYRRGDYEFAARFFEQAQAGQDDLGAAERADLANRLQLNRQALKARSDGGDMLRRAEEAWRDGRAQEAADCIKQLAGNQFLAQPDKARVQQLTEQLRPRVGVIMQAASAEAAAPLAQARVKLQQARALMVKGDFNAAEALANEADVLGAAYNAGEDTPVKVREDIVRARVALGTQAPKDLKPAIVAKDLKDIKNATTKDLKDAKLPTTLVKDAKDVAKLPTTLVKDAKDLKSAQPAPKEPKALLAAARQALERGDLERAESYAKDADKAESSWAMHMPWSDSPGKVLKDVQSARTKLAAAKTRPTDSKTKDATVKLPDAKMPDAKLPVAKLPDAKMPDAKIPTDLAAGTIPVVAKTPPPAAPAASQTAKATPPAPAAGPSEANNETARELLKQARAALKDGKMENARELCDQAARKKPLLDWWEDNPDKLLAEIRRVDPKSGTATADKTSSNPKELFRQAREQYNAGKLEEAKDLCQKANAAPSASWGFFEDNPDKLLAEIQKTRVRRDQEESSKLLVEARKHYEKAEYEEAERKANRAERLHGPYSLWDLGDRPTKVLGDCQAARARDKKTKVPAGPGGELAQKDPVKKPDVITQATAKTEPKTPATSGTVTPATVRQPVKPATDVTVVQQPPVKPAVDTTVVQAPPAPKADPVKEEAVKLMAEVRSLQKEGRLVEARQKAMDAQRTGASFGLDEDRPERAMLELADLCNRKVESLIQKATDYAKTGSEDPARYREAEANLDMAKQLAANFGLDTLRIEQKLGWVRQAQVQNQTPSQNIAQTPNLIGVTPPPVAVLPPPVQAPPEQQRGFGLLEKALLELKAGNLVVARRLAEEAHDAQYGVRKQAEDMLRQCDVEEFNQKQLAAIRAYDVGLEAFKQKEFAKSHAILTEIDVRLLPPDKKSRVKELMSGPEIRQVLTSAKVPVSTEPGPDGHIVPVKAEQSPDNYAAQVSAMQEVKFQQMRQVSIQAQQDATAAFQRGSADQALEILSQLKGQLDEAQLDPERVTLLRRPVDARIEQFKTLKAQGEFAKLMKERTQTVSTKMNKDALAEEAKIRSVKELVDQYKRLDKEGKYREAEMAAVKARELDPDNPAIDAMIYTSKIKRRQFDVIEGKSSREANFADGLNDSEDEGPFAGKTTDPLRMPKDWKDRTAGRRGSESILIRGKKTEKEREIERRLESPINFEFKDTSLKQVVDDLRVLTGMNIVIDQPALDKDGVSTDRPLTMKLEGVSMKSALTLLLHNVNLTYVIKDEVLQITTASCAQGRLVQKQYPVADLVIPVDNYIIPPAAQLMKVLGQSPRDNPNVQLNGIQPYQAPTSLLNGTPTGSPSGSQFGAQQTPVNAPTGNPVAGTRNPGQTSTMEELLIRLITNTVAPQSWAEVGGPGTIDYWPLGMALVINQTPDVQEQVQELLDALRRLQDLEISVEVRMISLAEAFFERIGLDFNVNIKTDHNTLSLEPQIVTQQFKPLNYINDLNGHNNLVGLAPGSAGGTTNASSAAFTQDLDIPIRNSSFQYAIPPFGGYPGIPGADGGLSMGLAFLSDIEVFMFMEAAQGDKRTNVMQAPKLTLFNGQTSTIQIQDFQYFVTNVQVVQSGGQTVFVPQNQPIPLGVNLAVQAVVSADRRFVRLNLAPTMTNVAAATVPLFPITTFITPVFEGGAQGQPVPFTQFIQQPTFTSITIQTTVSVPDGGTVLLGGMKILNEGRNEFGPPVLSKIPYINRLFKNVGYGKDTSSLLIMVTPRVIINAEEELRQTGLNTGGPGGTGGIEP